MTILGVAAHAREHPGRLALVDGDRALTFAEVDGRANRIARLLAARGAGPNGRVAVALRNRATFFEIVTAAARLRAEIVPVPWRARDGEVAYLVEDSRAALLVAEPDARATVPAMSIDELEANLGGHDDAPIPEAPDPAPPLFRYYTSGTTGRPKAVERAPSPPDQAAARAASHLGMFGIGSDGVHLVTGPLYHTAPIAFAAFGLMLGHTLVVPRSFDAAESLALIERHAVTWMHVVPVNFVRWLGMPDDVHDAHDVSSLRTVIHAAAPCPVDVKRRMMSRWRSAEIWEYYGMTEGFATICPPGDWLRKPGTVGRPPPGLDVAILDERGAAVPAGEIGLVYVSGARFAYAGAPEKTEGAWRDDRFTVGDMGYLDADGFLYLTDRATDLIISGGANVYPAEVENVLAAHPAVADAAVVGLPDPEWGESVHAIVELSEPADAAALIAWCAERLSSYKCPRSVEVVDELPREPSGKLRKRELRQRYWSQTGRSI